MVVVLSTVISHKNGWDEAQILHVTSHGEGKIIIRMITFTQTTKI